MSLRLDKNLKLDLPGSPFSGKDPLYVHHTIKHTQSSIANLMLTGAELFQQHRTFETGHIEDEFDAKFIELIKNVITTLKLEADLDANMSDTARLLGELEELVYGDHALVEVTSIHGSTAENMQPERCQLRFTVAKESGHQSRYYLDLEGNQFSVLQPRKEGHTITGFD